MELTKIDGQHGDTLVDIVMKLTCNPRTFLFLCCNQPAAHAGKSLLCLFALGDIGKNRKSAGFAFHFNQFCGTEGCLI